MNSYWKWLFLMSAVLFFLFGVFLGFIPDFQVSIPYIQNRQLRELELLSHYRSFISEHLGTYFQKNHYPTSVEMPWMWGSPQKVNIQYTFNDTLQREADRLFELYKPDYGALIVMDANSGKVLALSSYQKESGPIPTNLALRASYPAASIFKIVTATAAIDKYKLSPDTLILFNGGNHTLYKKNVLFSKVNQWTREMTLKEAFARSINTVFGRLVFENMEPEDIEEYAIRFGFNQAIKSDLPIDTSFTEIPKEKNYQLAEIVSGYNRITRMSPIQGAMIAASVASDGIMRVPYIIESIKNDHQEKPLYESQPVVAAVTMSTFGAEKLKVLMEETILSGTSRKSFRPLTKNRKFLELKMGGKTGSLWGDQPKGKVDWFVGYAIGSSDQKLAIASITVNKEKWTVKSSFLAQTLFKKYFE